MGTSIALSTCITHIILQTTEWGRELQRAKGLPKVTCYERQSQDSNPGSPASGPMCSAMLLHCTCPLHQAHDYLPAS